MHLTFRSLFCAAVGSAAARCAAGDPAEHAPVSAIPGFEPENRVIDAECIAFHACSSQLFRLQISFDRQAVLQPERPSVHEHPDIIEAELLENLGEVVAQTAGLSVAVGDDGRAR